MKREAFFQLVEIQTKVASVIPFLTGIAFTSYRYQEFDPMIISVFFISLLCLDMATTAINNLMDLKVLEYGVSVKQAKTVIGVLLTVSMVTGLWLVYLTDIVVLLIGGIAFLVGALYSYGPLPISQTPFGEAFSGFFMGMLIFFVTVYIQIYELGFFIFSYADQHIYINIHIIEFLIIGLVSLPLILGIANIMLANNTCDLAEDIKNKRHTLPYYIGKDNAVVLFEVLAYLSYLWIIVGVVIEVLPIITLLVLLTLYPVKKNVDAFKAVQEKSKTFVCAVKNFVLISVAYFLTILLGIIVRIIID